MAEEGYVAVSYGYKAMKLSDFEKYKGDSLFDISYLCTFGLKNDLRNDVKENIRLILRGPN